MKFSLTSLFAACVLFASAQDSCHCTANLNEYIRIVSENYAGYRDKVNPATATSYRQLLAGLRQQAAKTTAPADCYALLERYRRFFFDKHLQLETDLPVRQELPYGLRPGKTIATGWDSSRVHRYLQQNRKRLLPLEGIWASDEFEAAIRFDAATNTYRGTVLRNAGKQWKAGDLLFVSRPVWKNEWQTYFQTPSLSWEKVGSEQEKDVLIHEFYGIWRKKFPATSDTLPDDALLPRFGDVRMQLLDSATLYIRLKSCAPSNKPVLAGLLRQYAPQLERVPNWIIDLRTNRGGSTGVFEPIEPYLFTHTYIGDGDGHWMTPGHTAAFEGFLRNYDSLLSEPVKAFLIRKVADGRAQPGSWSLQGGDTVHYAAVQPFPQRVAILSSRENASAGESFLITARGMSRKVTIFGTPSAGLLDYGDINAFDLPCKHFRIRIPSRRANYIDAGKAYDRSGFPPDVRIPGGTTDWIAFVRRWWTQQQGR